METKNNKIIYLLIILVLVNMLTTVFIYTSFSKKISQSNKILAQVIRNGGPKGEVPIPTINLDMPIYNYLGSEAAPVEIVIATDFQCTFCTQLHENIFPEIISGYVDSGLVKISYLPYPLEGIHEFALNSALAGAFIHQTGGFWDFYEFMFDNSADINNELINSYIKDNNYNFDEYIKFRDSSANIKNIRTIKSKLTDKGITGTPALIINSKLYSGALPYENLRKIINSNLKEKTNKVSTQDARILLEGNKAIFLDVRTLQEVEQGSVEGSINIDVLKREEFLTSLISYDKSKDYVVYCKSGTRSSIAYHLMKERGFKNVINMIDGYDGW